MDPAAKWKVKPYNSTHFEQVLGHLMVPRHRQAVSLASFVVFLLFSLAAAMWVHVSLVVNSKHNTITLVTSANLISNFFILLMAFNSAGSLISSPTETESISSPYKPRTTLTTYCDNYYGYIHNLACTEISSSEHI